MQPVYIVQSLLPGDCQLGCSLFTRFLNLPPGNCLPGVEVCLDSSEPTSGRLLAGVQPVYKVS